MCFFVEIKISLFIGIVAKGISNKYDDDDTREGPGSRIHIGHTNNGALKTTAAYSGWVRHRAAG